MAAVYLFSTLIFLFFFVNNYSKFKCDTYCISKSFILISAISFRLLFMILNKISYTSFINCIIDLIIGYVIYKFASKYYEKNKSLLYSAFYLLNPVVLIYSSSFKNLYSPYILSMVCMFICLYNKKFIKSLICFGLSLLFSFNSLIFIPVLIFAAANYIKEKDIKKRTLSVVLITGLISTVTYYLTLTNSYFLNLKTSLFSFPYASVNACNIWTMLGKNRTSIDNIYLGLSFKTLAIIVFLLTLGTISYLNIRWKNKQNCYFILGFLLIFITYLFQIGIGEEFFYMGIILLLLLFIVNGAKASYRMYVGFSILHFLNLIYSLSLYDPNNFNPNDPIAILISFGFLLAFIYTIKYFIKEEATWSICTKVYKASKSTSIKKMIVDIIPSTKRKPLCKYDYIAISVLTIFFAIIAFYRLGNDYAPETSYNMNKISKEIILDFDGTKNIDHLSIFLGNFDNRNISISSFNEETQNWNVLSSSSIVKSPFAWNDISINAASRHLKIISLNNEAIFNELIILDNSNNKIMPVNYNKYNSLFDEQDMYPKYETYLTGTLFDEVYHGRTAYEFIHGITAYETTHPPLGKIIMTIGIRIFGMNPFGWRFMSAILGIALVPLMYLFSKKLFKDTFIASVTSGLLCFDFMHFTLSRIGTIDIFIGFFILLMYYFMYDYYTMSFYDTSLKKTFIPLGLCGISMGLGIATKWTGVYAALGLAFLFFWVLFQRFSEYRYGNDKSITKKIFQNNIIQTIIFCLIFFILIPAAIYVLSYIPFIDGTGNNNIVTKSLNNIKFIFSYHSNLTDVHPASSSWYEWPFINRPILYGSAVLAKTKASVVNCLGNPLIWWTGAFAIIYMFNLWFKHKDKKAAFLCISYSAQLIPWIFVQRSTFIYHYFGCTLFMIMMIGYSMQKLMAKNKDMKKIILAYCFLTTIVFIAFYPVISGYPVDCTWASFWLKWLNNWVIV